MRKEPVFRKRGSSRAGQTLQKLAPFYLFHVFADHTVGQVEATVVVVVVGAIMVIMTAEGKDTKSNKAQTSLRGMHSSGEK